MNLIMVNKSDIMSGIARRIKLLDMANEGDGGPTGGFWPEQVALEKACQEFGIENYCDPTSFEHKCDGAWDKFLQLCTEETAAGFRKQLASIESEYALIFAK